MWLIIAVYTAVCLGAAVYYQRLYVREAEANTKLKDWLFEVIKRRREREIKIGGTDE
ncbi:MAG TPA: hypothetical protein GXX51_00555 [Firmicutes bacterium]|nr:hypothetical protein [Bacillota bacterium]